MTNNEKNGSAPGLLVVDNEAACAASVCRAGESAGFACAVVGNFDELRRLRLAGFSVIVLDLLLQDIDGIEVIRFLADQKVEAGLILAGAVDRRVLDAAQRLALAQGLNVVGRLPKPVAHDHLVDLLENFRPAGRPENRPRPPRVTLSDLRRGMSNNELDVYFQPKIDVATLGFVGVEALIRWVHPSLGQVPPDVFIDLAERTGLIGPLTRSVMERTFQECAQWKARGLTLKVAVNVSARSLNNLDLPDIVLALVQEHNIDPEQVVIEITESWLGNDEVTSLDILTRMRMKGFHLSIDDFGTGYSTMLQLKQIPFSELKLDQSFIRGAAFDTEARVILDSSIRLGQKLGLHVVAEGVEREEDWDLISTLGCDEAQGYFIAAPMRGAHLPDWLSRWNSMLGVS